MLRDGHNLKRAFAGFLFAALAGFALSGGFSETVRHDPDCRELAAALARAQACCEAREAARDTRPQSR
jgi:hypothetical protein